ncbi:N-6 DNA methylase [Paenarthrobacter sp. NPDC056912]|uniref:N-6 DNA methylase n=1 Tax=Paenarthrobacter sp. NPDC056912 TaxID=3345965 RepID=UPI0036703555
MPATDLTTPVASTAYGQLCAIGFRGEENGVVSKIYGQGYVVSVDFSKIPAVIDYGPDIHVERKTTSNLGQAESLVVLECVDRLLVQGYAPKSLVLEKAYKVGHNDKFLDIQVLDQHNKSYMLIECKTSGDEYVKEREKLLQPNGGQVFSYFIQERDTRVFAVYTSTIDATGARAEYEAVDTVGITGSNLQQAYASWTRETFTTGLFDALPYERIETRLRVSDLRDMSEADGGRIFNAFAEILRRHTVSDKPNAFNKIFNLFICKVNDEEKRGSEFLDFQWGGQEAALTVLNRLNDLYQKGLKQYLELDVADLSSEGLQSTIENLTPEQQGQLQAIFSKVRLYKDNNFNFIEIYDERSFQKNADIVRDVVRLLQKFRLRYAHKHPFMGNFFERLLNTSVKQESGQFFTPIPIARFICDSLPYEQIVKNKVAAGEQKFLPHVIDYASGSGHFLTEGMDRIDEIVQDLRTRNDAGLNRSQSSNLQSWAHDYAWAREFVYGVEKDYRLAKTAKVSCFLNGDGLANVICADGLGSFKTDPDYVGHQGLLHKRDGSIMRSDRSNQVFDAVMANPPFSVSQCKMMTEDITRSFQLASRLTNESDEIECLFLERTSQLLKVGGVAGVIFPTSLLSNNGVETDARRILLEEFEVIGITAFGGLTFMATGTPTSCLFLRKRANDAAALASASVENFMRDKEDQKHGGRTDVFLQYARQVVGVESLEAYLAILDKPYDHDQYSFVKDYDFAFEKSSVLKKLKTTKDYKAAPEELRQLLELKEFRSFVQASEKDRLKFWVLAAGQQVVTTIAPEPKAEQEAFLGYRFSDRSRHEGMMYLSGTDVIDSPLLDQENRTNPARVSGLVRSNFLGDLGEEVPEALQSHTAIVPLWDLIDFTALPFQAVLRTSKRAVREQYSAATDKLGRLAKIVIGGTPSTQKPKYYKNGTNVWVSVADLKKGGIISSSAKMITDDGAANSNVKLIPSGTTLVSFKLTIGATAIAGKDLYTNEAIAGLVIYDKWTAPATDDDVHVTPEYLNALFTLFPEDILQHGDSGSKKIGKSLNSKYLAQLDIPVLSAQGLRGFMEVFEDSALSLEEKQAKLRAQLW